MGQMLIVNYKKHCLRNNSRIHILWGVSQADGPRVSAPRVRGDSDPRKYMPGGCFPNSAGINQKDPNWGRFVNPFPELVAIVTAAAEPSSAAEPAAAAAPVTTAVRTLTHRPRFIHN